MWLWIRSGVLIVDSLGGAGDLGSLALVHIVYAYPSEYNVLLDIASVLNSERICYCECGFLTSSRSK